MSMYVFIIIIISFIYSFFTNIIDVFFYFSCKNKLQLFHKHDLTKVNNRHHSYVVLLVLT